MDPARVRCEDDALFTDIERCPGDERYVNIGFRDRSAALGSLHG